MAVIYQTDDIEKAVRHMHSLNESSIVFQHSFTRWSIRERLDLVSDIPSVLVRPWDSFAPKTIRKWQSEKGLMFYRHFAKNDLLPECDALLFTCCPLSEKEIEQFIPRVRNEIIIFRPPDWSMHDETINFNFPMGDSYQGIIKAIHDLKYLQNDRNQELAIEYSGWDRKHVSAFSSQKIESMAGLKKGQFSKMVARKFFIKRHYHRYEVFQPVIAPKDADLLEMYNLLFDEPNLGSGIRMLNFGKLRRGYVKFFNKALKILVKNNFVIQYESVHVVKDGFKEMDYEIHDAISTVKRDQCLKFRKIVEESPDYLRTGLQSQSESILCEAQIPDKSCSVQQEPAADQN